MSALDDIRHRVANPVHPAHRTRSTADRARMLDALDAVLAVHQPVDALMYGSKNAHKVQVCTGCGQDDGNWNRHPCPTVRAVNDALEVK